MFQLMSTISSTRVHLKTTKQEKERTKPS